MKKIYRRGFPNRIAVDISKYKPAIILKASDYAKITSPKSDPSANPRSPLKAENIPNTIEEVGQNWGQHY